MDQYRDASYEVILLDSEPVGRLYVDRRKPEICIIDIAILPMYRNRGVGSALLHELLAESDRTQLYDVKACEHSTPYKKPTITKAGRTQLARRSPTVH